MTSVYDHNFYKDHHRNNVYAALAVLSVVVDALPEVRSAVDFGCGVGTWLSVLKEEKGVSDILGIDGPWVEQDLLEIPRQCFRQANLEEGVELDRRYDLAITLEVAEHLSDTTAIRFVESLVTASDFVLFSAAIPFQGGTYHINEQWPDYWAGLFSRRGYVALDFVRRIVWNDKQIPPWYRQNVLLFVKEEEAHRVKVSRSDGCDIPLPLSLVHPDLYLWKVNEWATVKGSWRLLRQAVKNWIKSTIRVGS